MGLDWGQELRDTPSSLWTHQVPNVEGAFCLVAKVDDVGSIPGKHLSAPEMGLGLKRRRP